MADLLLMHYDVVCFDPRATSYAPCARRSSSQGTICSRRKFMRIHSDEHPSPQRSSGSLFRCPMVDFHKMHMENYIAKAKTQAPILNDAVTCDAVLRGAIKTPDGMPSGPGLAPATGSSARFHSPVAIRVPDRRRGGRQRRAGALAFPHTASSPHRSPCV